MLTRPENYEKSPLFLCYCPTESTKVKATVPQSINIVPIFIAQHQKI